MDNDLVVYIERLQLMAFFSGYPLIYALVNVLATERSRQPNAFVNRLVMLLPFAYALTGVLFLGFAVKNLYPDYSVENISEQFTYIKIWAIFSVLFWIPAFSKKPVFSLLHSLIFFFILLRDLFMYMTSYIGMDMIKNDMRVYTDSLLLNTGTLTVIVILYFIIRKYRK